MNDVCSGDMIPAEGKNTKSVEMRDLVWNASQLIESE